MNPIAALPTCLRKLTWRLAAAGALLGSAPGCLAFGGVGFVPDCASFTTCSAAVASSGFWNVRREVSDIQPGFIMPSNLVAGVTVYQGHRTVATTAALLEGNHCVQLPCVSDQFSRGAVARAQSDFRLNRVKTDMSRGVDGTYTSGNGSARVSLATYVEASSAWRDVLSFSGSGHFSGVVAIHGSSSLDNSLVFDSSYVFTASPGNAGWFYDLRVWDVTNFSISEDFELGGPTAVGRARVNGFNEVRSNLDSRVALDFDFASGVSYVLTAELRATSLDGREINLYNTARLQDVVLTGGATVTALSGHDYLAPVPEPRPAAILTAGLVALALWSRRRSARA